LGDLFGPVLTDIELSVCVFLLLLLLSLLLLLGSKQAYRMIL